ncbi:hypothetical protein F5888DRAFT_1796133 [Russula emetica]|nr:hypothetical protein F5888DRAFT_1796133 [Russula emetica]
MFLPPGLLDVSNPTQYIETSSGGDGDWLTFTSKKLYTNAFIILLGYKKRGFGAHLYNGFGGKVEDGELPAQAALRELKEECGIEAPLNHCGTLLFIELYRSDTYGGTLIETEEMRPEWFSAIDAQSPEVSEKTNAILPPIPYGSMWPDDVHWMPLLLANRPFVGRADFDADASGKYTMLKWWFGVPSR